MQIDKTEALLDGLFAEALRSKTTRAKRAENELQLKDKILSLFALSLPDKTICEGHQSPFSFFSDMYFGRQSDVICWSCRSGGKTLDAALLLTMYATENKNFTARILGGSSDQSSQCYGHVKGFCLGKLNGYVDGEPLATRVTFKNGSEIQMLAASQKSVRGPHPAVLILDEADEVDREVYQAAVAMPQSQRGYISITAILSTMHNMWGLMQELVDRHEDHGRKLYKWCIFEILEDCHDYTCSSCYLLEDCQEKGKTKGFSGYYKIGDAIKKRRQLSEGAWEAEYLCIKPSFEGLVYREFNPDIHVMDLSWDPNIRTDAGCDFGFDNPMVCLVIQEANDIVYVVDEYYEKGVTGSEFAEKCRELGERYNIQNFYPDPSGAAFIQEMINGGLNVSAGRKVSVQDGIEKIKSRLKNKLFFVSKKCVNTIREFGLYRYKKTGAPDAIVKEDDHTLDALRYAIVYLSGAISNIEVVGAQRIETYDDNPVLVVAGGKVSEESEKLGYGPIVIGR